MGKYDTAERRYFSDNRRFASIINLWAGFRFVHHSLLHDITGRYDLIWNVHKKRGVFSGERDIIKYLENGRHFLLQEFRTSH